jgi:hypothetical protein
MVIKAGDEEKAQTIVDPQDLHGVVKAALLKAQFPVGNKHDPSSLRLMTMLPLRAT